MYITNDWMETEGPDAEPRVTHQYWQHKRSGEIYAVRLIDGEPRYVCGPLYYADWTDGMPDQYNFDAEWDDNPDDYQLVE